MSIAVSKTLQIATYKNMELIQSTPVLISVNLPIEEGQPIIISHQKYSIFTLRRRDIIEEILDYVMNKLKKKGGFLTLEETIQIIIEFINKHRKEVLEYVKRLAREKLKGIIEVEDSRINIVNKERYINIVLETYRDAEENLSTLILRILKKKSEGKIVNAKAYIKILSSLSSIITFARACIEVNRAHPNILDITRLLNAIVASTIIRDLTILKIKKDIDENVVEQIPDEEKQLLKVINELTLNPDKIINIE